jgi:hypothetical protein
MKLNQSSQNIYNKNETYIGSFEDFEEIVDLILSLPETETEFNYDVDTHKVVNNIAKWMASYLPLVYRDPETEELVGVMLFEEHSNWWSTDPEYLHNTVLYIKPKFRNTKLLTSFLENAEKYAKISDKQLVMGFAFVNDLGVKEKLLEKKGYERVASFYIKADTDG